MFLFLLTLDKWIGSRYWEWTLSKILIQAVFFFLFIFSEWHTVFGEIFELFCFFLFSFALYAFKLVHLKCCLLSLISGFFKESLANLVSPPHPLYMGTNLLSLKVCNILCKSQYSELYSIAIWKWDSTLSGIWFYHSFQLFTHFLIWQNLHSLFLWLLQSLLYWPSGKLNNRKWFPSMLCTNKLSSLYLCVCECACARVYVWMNACKS